MSVRGKICIKILNYNTYINVAKRKKYLVKKIFIKVNRKRRYRGTAVMKNSQKLMAAAIKINMKNNINLP